MRSVLGVRSFPYYVPWASLSPVLPSVRPLRAVPGEAGDAAVLSSLPREGQEVVLDRLDFVLTSLVALRREVEAGVKLSIIMHISSTLRNIMLK